MAFPNVLSALILSVALLSASTTHAAPAGFQEADTLYREQSYQMALKAFAPLLAESLPDNERREILFKWAHSVLKSKDEAQVQDALDRLEEVIEADKNDRWEAESYEALARYYLEKDRWQHQEDIKNYFWYARDYWAGSANAEEARERFIDLSFTMGDYITSTWGWGYMPPPSEQPIPLTRESEGKKIRRVRTESPPRTQPVHTQPQYSLVDFYQDVLKVAKSTEHKARAHYSLGMAYTSTSYYTGTSTVDENRKKGIEHFRTVIREYAKSEWVDDSYYSLGMAYQQAQQFVDAAKTYRDFLGRFGEGESQWVDDIQNYLKDLTDPQLSVNVSYTFIPGSEIQFGINWRNIRQNAQVTFYKVDLYEELALDLNAEEDEMGVRDYRQLLKRIVEGGRTGRLPVQLSFPLKLANDDKHEWHNEHKGLAEWQRKKEDEAIDPKTGVLPPGAYIMVVSSGEKKAYELVVVTDIALISKTGSESGLFFVQNAKTGEPVPEARIKFHYYYYDGKWKYTEDAGSADKNGLWQFSIDENLRRSSSQAQVFAVVSDGVNQAFVQNYSYYYNYGNQQGFRLYAYSDRPAYRPGEEIAFKAVLRNYDGAEYHLPTEGRVKVYIHDPRSVGVHDQIYTINEYGAIHGVMTLSTDATLGEYHMVIYSEDGGRHLASAPLFRLEEYKLPEYSVEISTAPVGEGAGAYQLGDEVKVDVKASYYFGGPVAGAQVEYLVYESPYYHHYIPYRKYPWYYEDFGYYNRHGYYQERLVKQEKITTDSEGRAIFAFETPEESASDLEYRVEVRVVDQSRREITASQTLKITKTAYFAYLEAERHLYRPGDQARVTIKTLTPNEEPVAVDAKVTVSRYWWKEPVVDAAGKVAEGGRNADEAILTKFVKTNEKGEGVFEFSPERDGYYQVTFSGFDKSGAEVKAQANVYVAQKESTDLGFRYGGLQIITEKDTYKAGDVIRAMVVSDQPGNWVLLTSEADDIYSGEVLHLDGTVKLIEMPVTGQMIPNIFLTALSTERYQVKSAQQQIIIPPDEKFLNIKITAPKEVFEPREEADFDLEVTDQNGNPVRAELSLGITDASVYYIQSEYAGDIRKFFFGQKRTNSIGTQISFAQRAYAHFGRDDENRLVVQDQAAVNELKVVDELVGDKGYNVGGAGAMRAVAESDFMPSTAAVPLMAKASAPMERRDMRQEGKAKKQLADKEAEGNSKAPDLAEAELRSDFRSTVIWQPSIVTDSSGKARVHVRFPDSLTTWRATARAVTAETRIGNMTYDVRTKKDLIVRLQSPRFFTERDLVAVSAVINNNTDQVLTVHPRLLAEGATITGLYENGQFVKGEVGPLNIPAGGELRQDWALKVDQAGIVKLTVEARSDRVADAMTKSFVAIPHGIEKFVAHTLSIKEGEVSGKEWTLTLPKERIKEATTLDLHLSPSLALGLLDALPYLADYPYGCVEQTMSRFLPAVIVRKTMKDLGLSERDINSYINDALVPSGDYAGHPERERDVSFNKVDEMAKQGLKRLYDFQHADGGWGWWKEGDSDRFMTAYVVWGLGLLQESGMDVRGDAISRGVTFLRDQMVEEENHPDMLAWMLHAQAHATSPSVIEEKYLERLWEMRDQLNPYTRALFAIAQHRWGRLEAAQTLARNLANGAIEDLDNGTVHWGEAGIYYRFSEGGVEGTSFVVKALSLIDPQSEYLEPAVRWLVNNRRGSSWKNTRDTAIAILGLSDYVKSTDEFNPDFRYTILVNGQPASQGHITPANMFSFARRIHIPAEQLKEANTIRVEFEGKGRLYTSAFAEYFTLEEGITPAANEIAVERKYYKEDKTETLMKGYTTQWTEIKDGDTLKSGDRVQVELTIDAKNHYEYLVFEDFKPAGLEAVELKSGAGFAKVVNRAGKESGEQIFLYQEFRDQKAAFFISKLPQGKYRITYELRAEIPGDFHGMPNVAHAMYVPEIRANSSEFRIQVRD